jgi:two-component system phosphate regulon response regulator OmpR
MQENYKILVVDDDMRLRALLERYLTEQGFQVRSVANAEQMDRLLTRESFHLMVLDLMLPGEDGLSICRRLRSQSNPMPIIMVTAKGEEVDRIVGLEIGADDYIPKPFNPRELLARIRAVLRRQANELPGAPSQEEAVIAFGKFKLNLGTREMFREDEPMPLTSGEFAVLKALVSHPREPLSRDKLMNLARGREYSAMERSIDVQILVCAAWWKKIRRILVIFRPSGVWATCSCRTALKHEANALLAAKFVCPHAVTDRHLAVRQPGDDLPGGAELCDPAQPPAV